MKKHILEVEALQSYLGDMPYHTFASSFGKGENKKLEVSIGNGGFRVLNYQEIVFEGMNPYDAVRAYNEIQGPPIDSPKTDN